MPKFCENNLPECIENRNNVRDIMSRIKVSLNSIKIFKSYYVSF